MPLPRYVYITSYKNYDTPCFPLSFKSLNFQNDSYYYMRETLWYRIYIYCGKPTSLGLLGSLSVVSRGSTVRHPAITKSRPMSEFGRVTVTTKLGQLS